jgi:hypothetical protein
MRPCDIPILYEMIFAIFICLFLLGDLIISGNLWVRIASFRGGQNDACRSGLSDHLGIISRVRRRCSMWGSKWLPMPRFHSGDFWIWAPPSHHAPNCSSEVRFRTRSLPVFSPVSGQSVPFFLDTNLFPVRIWCASKICEPTYEDVLHARPLTDLLANCNCRLAVLILVKFVQKLPPVLTTCKFWEESVWIILVSC